MRNVRLVAQYNSIQSLLERTRTATGEEVELQGHWGRYLCILAAGLLENSIREIYSEYVRSASSPQVGRFAASSLQRVLNPNSDRFVRVARSFSLEWGSDLEVFLTANGGQRKDAIDSIIAHRNLIAHGREASISVAQMMNYLQRAVEVIDFLESQCGGIERPSESRT